MESSKKTARRQFLLEHAQDSAKHPLLQQKKKEKKEKKKKKKKTKLKNNH